MLLSFLLAAAIGADSVCVAARELRVRSTADVTLAATVEGPGEGPARAVILMIAGAGEFDRDVTVARYPAYREWARELVAAGFMVVRSDKRGVGQSTGSFKRTATTATLADDVNALVVALRSDSLAGALPVVLLGHSEGGAVAGLAAARDSLVAGVILLAAPAWRGDRIMAAQHRALLADSLGWPSGYDLERRLTRLLRIDSERRLGEAWYPFFLEYDPLPAYAGVRAPILAAQGELDWRVTPEQVDEIVAAARGGKSAEVSRVRLPDHDHVFAVPGDPNSLPLFSRPVRALVLEWLIRRFAATPGRVSDSCVRTPQHRSVPTDGSR